MRICRGLTAERINPMPGSKELLHSNLHEVFSELAGYVFEQDGPRYAVAETAALAWRVGPPGKPIARGLDVLTIRDGRVSAVHTLIAPEQDA